MQKLYRNEPAIQTVISGSFRKHLSQIVALKSELEKKGIGVLSPQGNDSINPEDEFIILDSDPIENPELLQSSIFAKMRRSTFLVVANFGGYLGNAAILEIGYAIAIGIQIFSLEPIQDPNIAPYCRLLEEIFPSVVENIVFKKSKLSKISKII